MRVRLAVQEMTLAAQRNELLHLEIELHDSRPLQTMLDDSVSQIENVKAHWEATKQGIDFFPKKLYLPSFYFVDVGWLVGWLVFFSSLVYTENESTILQAIDYYK